MDVSEARRRAPGAARHPWERARLDHVRALLGSHGVVAPAGIVDVGAGDGFVARALSDDGYDVCAIDTAWSDQEIATVVAGAPRLNVFRTFAARAASSHAVNADAALLLDVIEHVDDDRALLTAAAAAVRPQGIIVVTVPAWPHLMSRHDDVLGHRRRYTPDTLKRALNDAALDVVEWGGCFHSLFLPRAVTAWRERGGARTMGTNTQDRSPDDVGGVSDVEAFSAPRVVADAITSVLRAELRVSRAISRRGHHLPGLSLYAVARTR